ncbi:MAG: preprotein translocase subunit YajC [Phycisphaerae bacterium]|nr:preprotein translocase subunit YajC [Phycisphaerae bacterium]
MNWYSLCLLAQQKAPSGSARDPLAGLLLPALLVFAVVFMFVSSRSARKNEQKRRDQMLAALSKNDRVLTHGGIIGTIVAIKDNEIVLKVDESTNTKMTFIKDAVRQVVKDPADLHAGELASK